MEPAHAERLEKVIAEKVRLHGNMAVLSKLNTLLRDANSELSEIEGLIQSDGPIAANVVKISNGALFGFSGDCETVDEALRKVGYAEALRLVSIALSEQVFMRDLDSYGTSADDYWRYSYFTSVFMEAQSKRIGLDPGDAHMIGLLHSIGRVVINELLRVEEIEVYWDRMVPLAEWEEATVGFNSDAAGATLLRQWSFSEDVYRRVAEQSDPGKIASDPYLRLLDYARALAVNLDDDKAIESLCEPEAHSYLEQGGDDVLNGVRDDLEFARKSIDAVYENVSPR